MRGISRRAWCKALVIMVGVAVVTAAIPVVFSLGVNGGGFGQEAYAFVHKKKGGGKSANFMALEATAKGGDPDAQFAVARSYETGNGVKKNKNQAINWYFTAGETYLQKGNKGQANTAMVAINKLSPGHPKGQMLAKKIEKKK